MTDATTRSGPLGDAGLLVPCLLGVLLHLYAAGVLAAGPVDGLRVGLVAWSCVPYAGALALAWLGVPGRIAAGAAAGALLGDLYMHYVVFVAPDSSNAALGLVAMPLLNLVLLGPLGAVGAWALARLRGGSPTARR